ncbi:hypothetical protein BP5796_11943 [Coleophoma crateriformis]|uniref:Late sexual development protein n=1 Tax=Coleophoma crateriformis TaxID=565419 RepID=A0A3D8QB80_9HELO|nr:hypothetical protein BP5796_11943 [Coleophoma crateriformis]
MRFINPNLLPVVLLLASLCCAAPVQQLRNYDRKRAVTTTVTVKTQAQPTTTTTVKAQPMASTTTASAPAKSSAAAASATPGAPAAAAPGKPAMGPPNLLSQLTAEQAGGGVPGGPPPQTTFSANAIRNFKVANFIEGIESGFFAGALQTLNKDPTFTTPSADGKSISNVTTQIAAQELVHKATLEGLLGLAMEPTVPSCTTIFPVTDSKDYLAKANVVTSAAIGVIINILQSLSGTDPNLISPLSSILSVESQQDAFFRMSGSNTPSASPFNTGLSTTFAYNIALTYVDPRSCPQLPDLAILPSLNLTSPMVGATAPATPPTSITFTASGNLPKGNLYIGWVNQANPVAYSNVTVTNGIATADIPAGMTGIAFAALTTQTVAMTVDGLTNSTLAGPAVVLMS